MNAYRRGALLVAGAALIWSSAGLLARLTTTDAWSMMFWRAVFAALGLGAILAVRDGRRFPAALLRLGWAGWALALCFALSSICFLLALSHTTVAAVMVFQGASPLFAAALAWALMGERVAPATMVAIGASVVGVILTVSGDPPGRTHSVAGDVLAAVMGLTYAATIVLARWRMDVPVTAATFASLLVVAAVAAPLTTYDIDTRDMALLAWFGFGQMSLALIMFAAGVRLVPAADAGLISLLECVLGPLWVWLALGEDPGGRAVLGGTIVVVAVALAARRTRPAPPGAG